MGWCLLGEMTDSTCASLHGSVLRCITYSLTDIENRLRSFAQILEVLTVCPSCEYTVSSQNKKSPKNMSSKIGHRELLSTERVLQSAVFWTHNRMMHFQTICRSYMPNPNSTESQSRGAGPVPDKTGVQCAEPRGGFLLLYSQSLGAAGSDRIDFQCTEPRVGFLPKRSSSQ